MRISKEPEVRRQEMIDTAMKLFAKKGYENTSMTDIAKEMNVVSGLCYRYFRSKEELYEVAMNRYAEECSAPVISLLNREYQSIEECMAALAHQFIATDGKEKYHDFYHGVGNEMFHKGLELKMNKLIAPHVIKGLEELKAQGLIKVTDVKATALFILYGQAPIMDDETLSPEQKMQLIFEIIKKILF